MCVGPKGEEGAINSHQSQQQAHWEVGGGGPETIMGISSVHDSGDSAWRTAKATGARRGGGAIFGPVAKSVARLPLAQIVFCSLLLGE
jgi:hypothetical protein